MAKIPLSMTTNISHFNTPSQEESNFMLKRLKLSFNHLSASNLWTPGFKMSVNKSINYVTIITSTFLRHSTIPIHVQSFRQPLYLRQLHPPWRPRLSNFHPISALSNEGSWTSFPRTEKKKSSCLDSSLWELILPGWLRVYSSVPLEQPVIQQLLCWIFYLN